MLSRQLIQTWVVVSLLLATACGKSAPATFVDAQVTVDANHAPDAPPTIDATPPAPVVVTVLDLNHGTPAANVDVIIEGSNGVPTEMLTDLAGTVTATIEVNSTVTMVQSNQVTGQLVIQSIESVQPGDSLTMGASLTAATPIAIGQVQVTAPPLAQGTHALALTTCGRSASYDASTMLGVVELFAGCTHGEISEVALTSDGNDVSQFISAPDQPLSAGQQVALAGQWTNAQAQTIAVLDIPALVTFTSVRLTSLNASGSVMMQIVASLTSSSQASIAYSHHTPAVGQASYLLGVSAGMGNGVQRALQRSTNVPTQFHLGPTLLPWIDAASSYDAASRQISWTQTGDGAADAVLTQINDSGATWTVLAPAGTTTVALPHLPGAYSAYDPASASPSDGTFTTTLVGNSPSVDYGAIRTSSNPFFGAINASTGSELSAMPPWDTTDVVTSTID